MSKEAYNKIVAKLERMDEYLAYLKEIQKVNKKVFLGDFHFFGLAERYLQLVIEVVLDTAKLVLIVEGLKRVETNSDVFEVLAEKGVISKKLLLKISAIGAFRNILVHDYEKLDREIVYDKLKKNLDDFSDFKKEVLKFLKKKF